MITLFCIQQITNPKGENMQNKALSIIGAVVLFSGSIISQASATTQDEDFTTNNSMSVQQFQNEIEAKASTISYVEIQIDVPGESSPQTFGTLGLNLTLDQVIAESEITIADLAQGMILEASAQKSSSSNRFDYLLKSLKQRHFKVNAAKGKSKSKLWNTSVSYGRSPKAFSTMAMPAAATPLTASAPTNCGTWRPNFHANIAAPSTYTGYRYDQLKFAFTQGQLDSFACTGSTGFEPDLVTDNYDGLHYLGDTVVNFSSNMPFSYLDTNFMDASEERVYTVGTYNISAASAYTEYTSYVRTENGNAATDRAKVVWQRNSMPFACYPIFGAAYCSFADESKIEYAWKFPLPGTFLAP